MKKLILLLFCAVLLVSLTGVAHAGFMFWGGSSSKGNSGGQRTSLPSNVCVFNFDSIRYDGDHRNGNSNNPGRGWEGVGFENRGGSHGSGPVEVAAVPAPVPEPATMLLLGAGLIGLAAFVRRKVT